MTKEELEQLKSLRQEIKEIQADIKEIQEKRTEIIQDKVQSSSKEFPYIKGSTTIRGVDPSAGKRRRKALLIKFSMLEARKKEAEELELRIMEYINSIQNSEIRRIIDYKYIENMSWEQIGNKLNCDRTTVEKKLSTYLRKNPEVNK